MKKSKIIQICNTDKTESLSYRRPANKYKDGATGFIYLHSWSSGYQELIFSSHEKANKFFN